MYNVLNHLQEDHIDMLLFEICKYTSMHRVKNLMLDTDSGQN